MSFRLKTILGIAAIEATLLLLLIWNTIHYLEKSNQDQLLKHTQTTLALLSTASRDALLSWDLATLEAIAEDARNMPGLVYVRMLDSNGKVLASAGSEVHLPKNSAAPDDTIPADGVFDQFIEIRESETLFGRIEVGVDATYINTLLLEAKQRTIVIASVEMLLVALFSLMLGSYLTRQLTDLSNASRQVGKGRFDYRLAVKGKDELAQTAAAFNVMADNLQNRIERERTIMHSAFDAIVTMDCQGRIIDFNPAAERIFGYRAEDVKGKPLSEKLVPYQQRSAHEKGMKHYLETGEGPVIGNRLELTAMHSSGQEFPIELAVEVTPIEGRPFFISYMRDITERIENERILREAKEAAEAGSRAKTNFLAVISHEVRTPLNAVLGLLSLLEETELNSKQRHWIETARTSGRHLLGLINNLLDYTKIEAGKIILEPTQFEIRQLLEETLDMLYERAEAKNLDIAGFTSADVPVHTRGDAGRIRQVLVNIVGNALKFTDSGSVLLELSRCTSDGKDLLRFAVTDTGPGIAPEMREHIFDEFTQLESSSRRRHEGTGLGLAISKRLVEAMRGMIGIESNIQTGACFWFQLPIEEPLIPPPSLPDLKGRWALVLETGDASRYALTQQLNALNVAVDAFPSISKTASHLQQLKDERVYDWVFIDSRLAQQWQEAKLLPFYKSESIILLISNKKTIACQDLASLGFNCYWEKPLKQSLLAGKMKNRICSLDAETLERTETRCEDQRPASERTKGEYLSGRILLVEDSPTNQMVAVGMLAGSGLQVDVAENGKVALSRMKAVLYDLVLMDIAMPEMDGVEATECIRSQPPPACQVPVIALTAHSMGGDREYYLARGFNDYLSKPIEKALLLKTVRFWLPDNSMLEKPDDEKEHLPVVDDALDESVLIELSQDIGAEMVPQMIDAFLKELSQRIKSFDLDLEKGDLNAARIEAHTIKSAAGTFGALKLQRIAMECEACCREENREAVLKKLPLFKTTANAATSALKTYKIQF